MNNNNNLTTNSTMAAFTLYHMEQRDLKKEPLIEGESSSVDFQNQRKQRYNAYVKSIAPQKSLALQMGKAFLVGGVICLVGQFVVNMAMALGADSQLAGSWCSLILVALSVLLTSLSQYQYIADFGGAGALVPITGFANSVSSAAIEYKTEGQVFGIGSKIFTIAGPVILYGILTSWALGLLYWLFF